MAAPIVKLERKYDLARETLGELWDEIISLREEVKAWEAAADEWQCGTPEQLKERICGLPETY